MVLYEINGHVWLTELREKFGSHITLGCIPESEIANFPTLGFTHLWLMGTWSTGKKSLAMAQDHFAVKCAEKGLNLSRNVIASPFSISGYRISRNFGTEKDFNLFREQLKRHRLLLILDAVFNHLGLDHPLVKSHPEYFISVAEDHPAASDQQLSNGKFIAHGKDPYFAPWRDTYQLDITRKETRDWLQGEIATIAGLCDGVRCDMAMLLVPEVFNKTWAGELHDPHADNFWEWLIHQIKQPQPSFLFIAEVYWDLEKKLLGDGFDLVYDKTFYDSVVEDRFPPAESLVRFSKSEYARHSLVFLENHDEPRLGSRIKDSPQWIAAHFLLLGMPSAVMIHHGQLEGRTERTPVQFCRWLPEKLSGIGDGVTEWILHLFLYNQIRNGLGNLLENKLGTSDPLFCFEWESRETIQWVVVNYGNGKALGEWKLPEVPVQEDRPQLIFTPPALNLESLEIRQENLILEMIPWGCAILRWNKCQ